MFMGHNYGVLITINFLNVFTLLGGKNLLMDRRTHNVLINFIN